MSLKDRIDEQHALINQMIREMLELSKAIHDRLWIILKELEEIEQIEHRD